MNQIVEYLQKISRAEDQVLIGLVRASRNIDMGIQIIRAVREANLGEDANAILDELLVVAQKLQQIAGQR